MKSYKPSFYNIVIDESQKSKIVFNSVTGAIAYFNNDTFNKMYDVNICSFLKETPQMYEKGFLVNVFDDEWEKLFYDRQCYIFNPNPVSLGFVIAPTLKCNLKCPYCFENDDRNHITMDSQTIESTIRYIMQSVENYPAIKEVFIVWFGGEPCLEINTIKTISENVIPFLVEKNIEYNSRIATNGLLLTKEYAIILKDICKVENAQITIDGLSHSYSLRKNCSEALFYKLINNIKEICDIININLRINIDLDNAIEIPQLLDYLLNENKLNGKININFAQLQKWNNEADRKYIENYSYIDFLHKIHKLILENKWDISFMNKRPIRQVGPCGSMRSTHSTIGPDGYIYRCEHCLGKPEWNIGNIYEGRIHNKNDLKFLCSKLPPKCSKCQAFPICAGGCTANVVLHNIPPSNCEIFVDMIKENVLFAVNSKSLRNR